MGLHLNLALACAFAIQIRRHRPRKDDAHDAQQKNDGEYSGDDVDLRAHGRHWHHLAHPPGSNARRREDDIAFSCRPPRRRSKRALLARPSPGRGRPRHRRERARTRRHRRTRPGPFAQETPAVQARRPMSRQGRGALGRRNRHPAVTGVERARISRKRYARLRGPRFEQLVPAYRALRCTRAIA